MWGCPQGSPSRPVMGCKDTLGPYWAFKPGQGPVSYSDGLRPGGQRPNKLGISGGQGPDDQGKRPPSDGQIPNSDGASGPRRSSRPRCQSRRQQWEKTESLKAGRVGKSANDFRPNSSRGHTGRIGKSLVDLPVQGG